MVSNFFIMYLDWLIKVNFIQIKKNIEIITEEIFGNLITIQNQMFYKKLNCVMHNREGNA